MKMCVRVLGVLAIILLLPHIAEAQIANRIRSLNEVLDTLYADMMPLCSRLIGVGRGIAGFAATWYIAARVWGHIARAEPVDFYPLFRPFVLGFCVLIFPSVLSMINGLMKPTVTGTAQMVEDSDKAITELLRMKEEAIKTTAYWQMYVGPSGSGDRDKWYKYHYGDKSEGFFKSIGNDIKFAFAKFSYNFRNSIKQWMSEVLKVLFEAAALCINTIRTFYMIVLGILGPLVFGIAVFDGFQHTLTVWIARYLNIFLWLPVANIFGGIMGKIQENMLKEDLHQIATNGDTFFSTTDTAYLIFMIIGIIGYFTVPSVANYIIHAGGGNALLYKVTNMMSMTTRSATSMATGGASMAKDALGGAYNKMTSSMADSHASGGYFKDKISGKQNV
ncbi:MAG TPA: conjugative transposon protein TraJ [Chitinophagaceae bacterium]|jgi:conjugative transposon TraJ protein|nr:conjugative transposon protein TraJ [Chitinophagaceae bacterium]